MIKWGILYDAKQEGGGLLSLFYKYTQNDDDDVIALNMEIFKIRFFFGRTFRMPVVPPFFQTVWGKWLQ